MSTVFRVTSPAAPQANVLMHEEKSFLSVFLVSLLYSCLANEDIGVHVHVHVSHVLAIVQFSSTSFFYFKRCMYTLFDGLTYNTHGHFVSCVVFFQALKRGKIQAMSKMSTRVIC